MMKTKYTALPDFSVFIGGAVAPGYTAVAVEMAHVYLANETDKAVQLSDDVGRRCWFPRKAFVRGTAPNGQPSDWWKIARWFRLAPHQSEFLLRAATVGAIAAKY